MSFLMIGSVSRNIGSKRPILNLFMTNFRLVSTNNSQYIKPKLIRKIYLQNFKNLNTQTQNSNILLNENKKKLSGKHKFLVVFSFIGLSAWLFGKYYLIQNDSETAVRLYKKLPLRSMSRAWGNINSIDLPIWCRKPCYYFYSWMFKCNLEEIDIEDLNEYKNLSEFFRRALKPDARVIDQNSCLISPCDGKILHFGVCDKGYLEQVKGVNYSLKAFLGEQDWPKNVDPNNNSDEQKFRVQKIDHEDHELYEKNILYNPKDNCLYHCIIYLAPGDYHRFHSPTDWEIYYRRHFPGELFSVNPSVARWLEGLFNLNERVVYYGKWKYGFFSMTAVGATNVGSIKVYMDEGLTTNNKSSKTFEQDLDKNFCETTFSNTGELNGVKVKRGENFGEFNLGSTIVLIFEAPKNFDFNVNQSDKVLFGSQLGSAIKSTYL